MEDFTNVQASLEAQPPVAPLEGSVPDIEPAATDDTSFLGTETAEPALQAAPNKAGVDRAMVALQDAIEIYGAGSPEAAAASAEAHRITGHPQLGS